MGGNALTWNYNNKLTSIGTTLTAGYSASGLRAWKQNASSVRTYFLYDGLIPVCELDGSGNVTAYNTVGANGLLARHVNGTGGGSVFYCFDPQGSVSVRVDTSGTVLSTHCNEAWGTQVSTGTGYSSDPYAGYGGQWGYYRDSETGLHLLGHRYYDVSAGRFLNRDPAGYGGGINLYGYCHNNSAMRLDPAGYSDPDGPVDPLKAEIEAETYQGPNDPVLEHMPGAPPPGMPLISGTTPCPIRAVGNTSGPRPPRIPSTLKPGQEPDIVPDENGNVGSHTPGGSSAFGPSAGPVLPVGGKVWSLPENFKLPPGYGICPDGVDFDPPGDGPPGHHSIVPTETMPVEKWIDGYIHLPWQGHLFT